MSILYKNIIAATALKSSQLEGTNQATLETNYAARTLDGGEIPALAFQDTILAIEKELVSIVASDNQNPYRRLLYGVSGSLGDKDLLPTVSTGSVEFIGVYGGVFDASDNTMLTEQPVQVIEDLSNSFFDNTEFYNFAFSGGRIRHTRAAVYIEGCIWSLTTQTTAYGTVGGTSPLPQSLENTWVAGVLANLTQESGWMVNEASYYAQVYANGIQMLKMRDLGSPFMPSNTANVAS